MAAKDNAPAHHPPLNDPKAILKIITCPKRMTTRARKDLLKTIASVDKLIQKAVDSEQENICYKINPGNQMDVGGILLMCYIAHVLTGHGKIAYVRGTGEAADLVLENVIHARMPPELRKKMQTKAGNFLARYIKNSSQMIEELGQWANSVREGIGASDEEVALWQTHISEVSTNTFQHGPSVKKKFIPTLLVAGQAFKEEGIVLLATLDFGSGIPRVIEKVSTPTINDGDGDLIAHACKQGITSRCVPQNQGAGLHTLVKMVQENEKGQVNILSHNGLVSVSSARQKVKNIPRQSTTPLLDGTLTVITIGIKEGAKP